MSATPAAVILDMEGVLHVDWQVLPRLGGGGERPARAPGSSSRC